MDNDGGKQSEIMVTEHASSSTFVGMKSSRRTAIVAIVREREARRKMLLEQCARQLSPLEPEEFAGFVYDESPFDENPMLSNQALHLGEGSGANNFTAGKSPTSLSLARCRPVDTRGRSPRQQKFTSTREPVQHIRTRVPFDESQIRNDAFDSVNFSPLVQFRSKQEKCREQTIDKINTPYVVSRPQKLVDTRDRYSRSDNSNSNNNNNNNNNKNNYSSSSSSMCKTRVTDLSHVKDDRLVSDRPVQNDEVRKRAMASSVAVGFTRSTGTDATSSRESQIWNASRIFPFSPKVELNQELPSDEEASLVSLDDQSTPSLDGNSLVGTQRPWVAAVLPQNKGFKSCQVGYTTDTSATWATRHRSATSSLAIEVSKFLLLKSIVEQADNPTTDFEVPTSVCETCSSSSSKSHHDDSKANEESKPLKKFARVSSVGVRTSERIMRSAHTGSIRSNVENVVVWSASRDSTADHRAHHDETEPIPTAISGSSIVEMIESHQKEHEIGSVTSHQYRTRILPATDIVVSPLGEAISILGGGSISSSETFQQKAPLGVQDEEKSCHSTRKQVLDTRSTQWNGFPPERDYDKLANKECTEADNIPDQTPQRVWSFYDPREVQALSLSTPSWPNDPSSTSHNSLGNDSLNQDRPSQLLQKDDGSKIDNSSQLEAHSARRSPSISPSEYDCSERSVLRHATNHGAMHGITRNADEMEITLTGSASQAAAGRGMTSEIDEQAIASDTIGQENPIEKAWFSTNQLIYDSDTTGVDTLSQESTASQDSSMISDLDRETGVLASDAISNFEFPELHSHTPRHCNKSFFSERSSCSDNSRMDDDELNGTVPDFAIEEVVDLMDRFKAEHEKNKHVFCERNLRRKSQIVGDGCARGPIFKREEIVSEPSYHGSVTVNKYSSADAAENLGIVDQGPNEETRREVIQQFPDRHTTRTTEADNEGISAKGTNRFGLNPIDPRPVDERDDHGPVDERDDQLGYERNTDEINRVNIVDEKQEMERQYQPFWMCHVDQNALRFMEEVDSTSEKKYEKSSPSRYDAIVCQSYLEGPEQAAPTTTSSTSTSQPSLDLPSQEGGRYASLSSFDSASLIDSLSESETYENGRKRFEHCGRFSDSGERILAASSTGLNPYRGPATEQMLKLFSTGRRRYVDAINNEIARSHDFACKCAAISFD